MVVKFLADFAVFGEGDGVDFEFGEGAGKPEGVGIKGFGFHDDFTVIEVEGVFAGSFEAEVGGAVANVTIEGEAEGGIFGGGAGVGVAIVGEVEVGDEVVEFEAVV